MRRWLPTLVAVAVALSSLAYLRWFDRPAPAGPAAVPDLIKLMELDLSRLEELEVAGPGYSIALRPAGPPGRWAVARAGGAVPAGQAPDQARVHNLLISLTPLFAIRQVVARADDPEPWGLAEPVWVLTAKPKDGQSATLRIGRYLPVSNSYYAARAGDPAVYTINDTLVLSLPENLSGWFATP